jgi:1,2-diacylglycerol 3-beta-glucosyltransferase
VSALSLHVADAVLMLLAVPALLAAGYLAALTVLSRRQSAPAGTTTTRFDVIVPAHNEASGIGATVRSLLSMRYPHDRFRVLVIADNCTDATAAHARAAGATVLERTHATERGKGYALAFGYASSLKTGLADAVVVVDADTSVSPNLLEAFSARFDRGAEAAQAEYGVRNANASWRTRLMVIALTMFHTVRSLGRERLSLSCGLRGNGMAFSAGLLRRVPPNAFSIVEDVEYGIALGLAGVRVVYVPDAQVHGDMPESAAASETQRERWEGGRWALVKAHVPTLVAAARAGGGRVPLDLAADLLVPPLTTLGLMLVAGLGLAVVLFWRGVAGGMGVIPWLAALLGVGAYVVRGAVLSGTGPRAVLDLMWAPVFAIWKITLMLKPKQRTGEWVRTARSDEI